MSCKYICDICETQEPSELGEEGQWLRPYGWMCVLTEQLDRKDVCSLTCSYQLMDSLIKANPDPKSVFAFQGAEWVEAVEIIEWPPKENQGSDKG